MSTSTDAYTIRGESLSSWGVEDTPELRDLLDAAKQEAYEDGEESGEMSARQDAEDVRYSLYDTADALDTLTRTLSELMADHAAATGTTLTMPDAHEAALCAVRDTLTAIATGLRG